MNLHISQVWCQKTVQKSWSCDPSLSRAFENTKPQNTKNAAGVNAENEYVSNYQAKMLKKNFTAFVSIDNDV